MACNRSAQPDFKKFQDKDCIREFIKAELEQIVSKVKNGELSMQAESAMFSEAINSVECTELVTMLECVVLENKQLHDQIVKLHHEIRQQKVKAEMFPAALDCITDAVMVLDDSGMILHLNRAATKLTSYGHDQIEGKFWGDVLTIVDLQHHEQYSLAEIKMKAIKGDITRCTLITDNGTEKTIALQGAYLRIGSDCEARLVLVLKNITEKEMLQQELFKIQKLESVSVLAGGIAHDFNNILTGITTNLFLARMGIPGESEAKTLITEAENAAFKATRLTNQLLTFSRNSETQLKETASLTEILEGTVGFCLNGLNVDYRLNLPEDLWLVDVDKGQIDLALNHLIRNAAQSMPLGGTIQIDGRNFTVEKNEDTGGLIPLTNGDYIEISIQDEGEGIPCELLGTIFDPYFSTKKNSTGLGLTTAYSIVRQHGGHIRVESELGKGSVFTFYLPASAIRDEAQKNIFSAFRGDGKSVLIMDDDALVRAVIEKLLRSVGFKVCTVGDGEEALKLYKEAACQGEKFSMVILDLTIPGGVGGEVAVKKLKEFDAFAKVIVISGYSNNPVITDYQNFGFDGVLHKPFTIAELSTVIMQVLSETQNVNC